MWWESWVSSELQICSRAGACCPLLIAHSLWYRVSSPFVGAEAIMANHFSIVSEMSFCFFYASLLSYLFSLASRRTSCSSFFEIVSYFYYNCSLSYMIAAFNFTSYTQVGFIILSILTQSYWCSLLVKGWFLCLNSPIQKYVMSLH